MSIKIFYDNVDFRVKSWRKGKKAIEKVITNENRISGDLNFILTGDKELKEINAEFLKHNYYTDVICFDYCIGNNVNGEIYISIDTVKRNAKNYEVSYKKEVLRVMIHGVLHLCGYDDQGDEDKIRMKMMEDYWLEELTVSDNGI